MAEIFHFVPRNELNAEKNLHKFIECCKNELTIFGSDLNWISWKWPKVCSFTKLGTSSRTKNNSDRLDDEFIEFAKAYFRYQQGHKPTKAKNELKALRAVEKTFINQNITPKICDLSITILDLAAQEIRNYFSKGAAYHGGRELERLAKFVNAKKLVYKDLSNWKNPVSRKKDEIQTGKKAKARREKKIPSEFALNALAEIFANNPKDPKDIFTSSTFALLMCAPSRVSEVLELPVDCEVEEKDSKGKVRYGWRFYSGKGYGANIKWIPSVMVGIAKEAISRIKSLTEEARKLAEWIESGNNKFYRHKDCPDVKDNKPLSVAEVCKALGIKVSNSALNYMGLESKDGQYTLNSLWQYVLSKQPVNFPYIGKTGLKFSKALFAMRKNEIGSQRGTSPVIVWIPNANILNNDLSPRETLLSNHLSIFDRYGYKNPDGTRIKLTSHQPRHLLNTFAQRGGLSQLQIAKWSGRAEASQNRVYNHMSEYEMVAMAEELDTSMELFGPSGEVEKHIPITIQEFNTMEKGAVHITEFGVCVHDFTMTPCEKFRDCLNCTEQICIKGEDEKLIRIKSRLEYVEQQFNASKEAVEEGLSGADRWYDYHKNTLKRLKELISIMDNPEVPNGAQIKLRNDKAFSSLNRAVASKMTHPSTPTDEDLKMLEDVSNLIGGGFG